MGFSVLQQWKVSIVMSPDNELTNKLSSKQLIFLEICYMHSSYAVAVDISNLAFLLLNLIIVLTIVSMDLMPGLHSCDSCLRLQLSSIMREDINLEEHG